MIDRWQQLDESSATEMRGHTFIVRPYRLSGLLSDQARKLADRMNHGKMAQDTGGADDLV
jgi:hypothetical protein